MSLSNVTVQTAAASRRLVKREDVKTELGISGSGDDSKLDRLTLAASLAIAGPDGLNREPWIQTYLERMPGVGGVYLFPRHWPIRSITSITHGTGSSPSTVTASDYSIRGDREAIYKAGGWSESQWEDASGRHYGSRCLDYNVTYEAGWVMPDKVTAWSATASVAAGDWYKPTTYDDEQVIFRAGGAGTTGGSEPTWTYDPDDTVTDNDITWTAYQQRLPQEIEEAAMIVVIDWFRGGLSIPSGVRRESAEGFSVEYVVGGNVPAIPGHASALLAPYRRRWAA